MLFLAKVVSLVAQPVLVVFYWGWAVAYFLKRGERTSFVWYVTALGISVLFHLSRFALGATGIDGTREERIWSVFGYALCATGGWVYLNFFARGQTNPRVLHFAARLAMTSLTLFLWNNVLGVKASNHTATTAIVAATLIGRWQIGESKVLQWWQGAVFVVLVAWSRVYLGKHTPFEVFAGFSCVVLPILIAWRPQVERAAVEADV